MKKAFTEEIEKFIHDNVKGMYVEDLVALVNDKFNTNYTHDQIKNYKNRHKLKSGITKKAKNTNRLFTNTQEEFIKQHVIGIGNRELVDMLNNKFGTSFTSEQIKSYKDREKLSSGLTGYFEKGHTPHNKGNKGVCGKGCERTWFKKGYIPKNHRQVGSERTTVDGYVEIKVAEPNKWELKHRVIWEQHNGPVPKNYVVIFLDGNKLNIDINNLALITRAELKILNQNKLIYDNAEATKAGVMIAKVIDTKNKRRKKRS